MYQTVPANTTVNGLLGSPDRPVGADKQERIAVLLAGRSAGRRSIAREGATVLHAAMPRMRSKTILISVAVIATVVVGHVLPTACTLANESGAAATELPLFGIEKSLQLCL